MGATAGALLPALTAASYLRNAMRGHKIHSAFQHAEGEEPALADLTGAAAILWPAAVLGNAAMASTLHWLVLFMKPAGNHLPCGMRVPSPAQAHVPFLHLQAPVAPVPC